MLSNLGAALRTRFERTGDRADLDAAVDAGRQAVAVEAASPRVRAVAARGWGRAAAGGRRWQEAVAGFAAAAELLGLVAPRSLTRADQEHLLEELGGLGADAAACCVHAGLADRAVELFEQGRGVLLGQALDTRTDLTALAERHPGLAARFTALRDDLDRAGDPAGPAAALPPGTDGAAEGRAEAARRDMERRRAAAAAFDQVIAEIRRLPGFRRFSPAAAGGGAAGGGRGGAGGGRHGVPVRLARADLDRRRCAGPGAAARADPADGLRPGGRLPRRAGGRLVTGRRCGWPGGGRAAAGGHAGLAVGRAGRPGAGPAGHHRPAPGRPAVAAAVVVRVRAAVVPAGARRRPPPHPGRRRPGHRDRPGDLLLHPDAPGTDSRPPPRPGRRRRG